MNNFIPVTGYVVVRAEIRWPRGEGAPAAAIVEHLGDAVAIDPETCAVSYIGSGRTGGADGHWNVTVAPDSIAATSAVVLPRENPETEFESIWRRLVRDLEARGVHQLVENVETA